MAKTLTPTIQNQLTYKDVKIKFVLLINNVDYSSSLMNWSIRCSQEFGSAQASFTLNNAEGVFGEEGENKLQVGDVVQFSEYFSGDPTEFKKFYGTISQRSINKTAADRTISLVCLDYIATLQYLDIDLDIEADKILVENETLLPNYLPSPNESLAQLFDFANNSLAQRPDPIIIIRNQNNDIEDPQYDGFEIYHENGQLKLGYPINALYNYSVVAAKYYFYVQGLYAEDIIEQILTLPDGYGSYLFGESSAQDVIDNHLIDTYSNVEGSITDTMTPNYTESEIVVYTELDGDIVAGTTSIDVGDATGLPTSGTGTVAGDVFTWSSKAGNTLNGIPASGNYALKAHKDTSLVTYTNTYDKGQVWYLKYSNVQTDLVAGNFTIPGATFTYFDKRYGRIILDTAIASSSTVTCDTDYSFKTLQASGIEINQISFRTREVENRFDALKKLKGYLAPNYMILTRGDNKIWSLYLSQRTHEDYTLQLETSISYLEDEDLYTRVMMFGKNKNPTNLMFGDGISFIGTGETYKATASDSDIVISREEGNFWVYGSPISGVGEILVESITPVVYLNEVPIDNSSHILPGQAVVIETTTKTETTTSGGGK